MRTQRQNYKDANYHEARKAGCDTLQLKYDGWWARVEIIHGQGKVFTQTQRELPQFAFQLQTEPINAVVVGELMFGTQWSQPAQRQGKLYLYDCWEVDNTPLETFDYKTRYGVLRTLLPRLPRNFERVQNFPITDYDRIWREFVETELFEGVVFRNSKATVAGDILRHKNTIRDDVQVVGFEVGQGKHEGRLGALLCRTRTGVPLAVGGGLDDSDREDIWANPGNYLQRWCEVEGRARFESGALRHPNFVSWRPPGWQPSA